MELVKYKINVLTAYCIADALLTSIISDNKLNQLRIDYINSEVESILSSVSKLSAEDRQKLQEDMASLMKALSPISIRVGKHMLEGGLIEDHSTAVFYALNKLKFYFSWLDPEDDHWDNYELDSSELIQD